MSSWNYILNNNGFFKLSIILFIGMFIQNVFMEADKEILDEMKNRGI